MNAYATHQQRSYDQQQTHCPRCRQWLLSIHRRRSSQHEQRRHAVGDVLTEKVAFMPTASASTTAAQIKHPDKTPRESTPRKHPEKAPWQNTPGPGEAPRCLLLLLAGPAACFTGQRRLGRLQQAPQAHAPAPEAWPLGLSNPGARRPTQCFVN